MRKKNKAKGITLPDFKLYYKATVIKTVWYQLKNRHIDQWNKQPRNKSTLIWAINLSQKRQEYAMGENCFFSKWYWGKWTTICKRISLDYFLTSYTKINFKCINDFSVRPETTKLGENIGSTLFDISFSNFLDVYPQARETKAKINKWDYIKPKSFCTVKETINKMKRLPTERKYICK